jgi:hypothetical protein
MYRSGEHEYDHMSPAYHTLALHAIERAEEWKQQSMQGHVITCLFPSESEFDRACKEPHLNYNVFVDRAETYDLDTYAPDMPSYRSVFQARKPDSVMVICAFQKSEELLT